MRHVWAGIAIGLLFFTAMSVALVVAILLIDLIGSNVVSTLVLVSLAVGATTAFLDYYTERR